MQPHPGGMTDADHGWNYSIYLMLGLLFGIAGVIVFAVARTIRREERDRAGREAAPPRA
jgi:hypothetical protein